MASLNPYRLGKVFLKFSEKETEHAFEDFSFNYDKQAFGVMTIAAMIINLLLIPIDASRLGDWSGPAALRLTICMILLFGYLFSLRISRERPRTLQITILLTVISFALSYFIGMTLVKYPDYSFPNSIISVVFFAVAISGLRFRNSVIYLLTILADYYLYVFVFADNEYWRSQSVAIVVNSLLGIAVSYLIERARRNIFIKNQLVLQQKEELEAAGAMKNKLFSILSHDLRGPLNKLIAMVDMLRKDHITSEEFKVHTSKLEGEMRTTAAFMENMLYWSKSLIQGYEIKPKQVDVAELIDHNIMAFSDSIADKNITLSINTGGKLFVLADEEMLNISLRNILSNAIKFTPKGGSIEVGYRIENDLIQLFVKDSGIGIDSERQKDLFSIKNISSPGTEGEKGTGLGLYLIKEFTEKNGGRISVESQLGVGSTFTLHFPKN